MDTSDIIWLIGYILLFFAFWLRTRSQRKKRIWQDKKIAMLERALDRQNNYE